MGKFKKGHLKYLIEGKKKLQDRAPELREDLEDIKDDINHIEEVESCFKR